MQFVRDLEAMAVACFVGAAGLAQTTERVSVSTRGAEGRGLSHEGVASADGRFIAFRSEASRLVGGDRNRWDDIFVRDRLLGTTTCVSLDSSGGCANQASAGPSISLDGRWVAFSSFASNLVAGDTNGAYDVFVHDRASSTTQRVSLAPGGGQADLSSHFPALSGDGRWIAFASAATNLVAGDTNGKFDVFVCDLTSGATSRVSVDSSGAQANDASGQVSISSDGRYVAFHSMASNLVAGDTNGQWDVFVHDRWSSTTVRASVDSAGLEVQGLSWMPQLSGDGHWLAFSSTSPDLPGAGTNGVEHVFVRDLVAGTTVRADVDPTGGQVDAPAYAAKLSADGRFVVFSSEAANLVAGDVNNTIDVFVRDLASGVTELVSRDSSGAIGNYASGEFYTYNGPDSASLSADGRFVVFGSRASNLVAEDTNWASDTFVRDRGVPAPLVFCTAGTTSHGCVPAISGVGLASATAGAGFTIRVDALEGLEPGLVFYGIDNSGWLPLPWGASSSWVCVRPPVQRTTILDSGGTAHVCDGALTIDWNAYVAAHPGALGAPFAAGAKVYAQAWFRDPAGAEPTALSDALEFVLAP